MMFMLAAGVQGQEADTTAVAADTAQAKADSVTARVKKPKEPVERYKDGTKKYPNNAIYQGVNLKLDLMNTALEAGLSKGKIWSAEIASNVRLKQRFYPTLEAGYAKADTYADGGNQKGEGGFFRVGLDIGALKKHPERLNALLVGVRVGTALQEYDLTNVAINNDYWGATRKDFYNQFQADCWGEVVAGVQVQVWEGFQMGWAVRLKILFTREASEENVMPYYIPGFGYRDNTNWGVNYYLGWKF